MANKLTREPVRTIATKANTILRKSAKKAAKHAAKKHSAKKHAAKKHAKKAAKHAEGHNRLHRDGSTSVDLDRAFHHLQRAAAVISLLDADSGSDLKDLLQHGVTLYQKASDGAGKNAHATVSLLSATEHLAMAGLYAARGTQLQNLPEPSSVDVEDLGQSIQSRLQDLAPETEYEQRLSSMTFELVKRADACQDDPHLAWELIHGANGLCEVLEAQIGLQ